MDSWIDFSMSWTFAMDENHYLPMSLNDLWGSSKMVSLVNYNIEMKESGLNVFKTSVTLVIFGTFDSIYHFRSPYMHIEDLQPFTQAIKCLFGAVQLKYTYTNNIKAEIDISLCIFTNCKIEHSICFPVSSLTHSLYCQAAHCRSRLHTTMCNELNSTSNAQYSVDQNSKYLNCNPIFHHVMVTVSLLTTKWISTSICITICFSTNYNTIHPSLMSLLCTEHDRVHWRTWNNFIHLSF